MLRTFHECKGESLVGLSVNLLLNAFFFFLGCVCGRRGLCGASVTTWPSPSTPRSARSPSTGAACLPQSGPSPLKAACIAHALGPTLPHRPFIRNISPRCSPFPVRAPRLSLLLSIRQIACTSQPAPRSAKILSLRVKFGEFSLNSWTLWEG